MAYNQAQNKATQKYQKEHLEQINIRVPKGTKERYHELARRRGTVLSRLIVDLLEAELAKEEGDQ